MSDMGQMREAAQEFYESTEAKPRNWDSLSIDEMRAMKSTREQNREHLRSQGVPEFEIDNMLGPEPEWPDGV
jgi:hypothetical protein